MNKQQLYPETSTIADILLVDDEPNNLRLLANMLTEQGYKTRGVINGPMALKAATSLPPDLILLDIMMPEMDGYQVCHLLQQDSRTCEIPVVFVSAKGEGVDKVKAFAVGGVDYITKPLQYEEVFARIEYHLKLYRLQKKLEEQNVRLNEENCQRLLAEKQLQEKNQQLEAEIELRKTTEEALQQSNAELARANAELEEFTAIASHDLKSPLSTISGYAQLLQIRYGSQLNGEGNDYLSSILRICHRMNELIGDLLSYSRLNKQPDSFKSLECEILIRQACENLEREIDSTGAAILYENLPQIFGDRNALVQLFQNLIGNGLKYRSQAVPEIRITASEKGDRLVFAIRDNGIGIDSQYLDKVFLPFKRFHKDNTPGTGMGLAICRKIVESHSGSIWVESKCDRGSTFYFSLPQIEASSLQNDS
ncbi:ATP-binding protein [Phormidium sp. CCY1219]|uniref:ATP-binding protein n=1 Tax=Phormidium sp. CCY1219 TaxID=2886104 RepID=UPI002D1F9591|nr:ATP-binding protein [Phormidium sp. CCY1219]MEB3828611.1 response regulator [Phormidium sp. CCY1219]